MGRGRTAVDGGAIRRWAALGATALTLSGAFALAAPGTAGAATGGWCAGRQVRALPFRTGTVHLYRGNGYVCAVTVAKSSGAGRVLSVSLQARGNRPVTDLGRYKQHAGPVTVHAGHRCVKVRGAVGTGTVSSGWILC
ncbi:hypothetical protein [Streptomyces sp. BV129]|uniref:hypothetical protein n=1 Tax=Streptomyces sp. BV129 TaxID=2849671 RepID=UPI0020C70933|nr:hypothetical protein [Streptomyces sp. BV129]